MECLLSDFFFFLNAYYRFMGFKTGNPGSKGRIKVQGETLGLTSHSQLWPRALAPRCPGREPPGSPALSPVTLPPVQGAGVLGALSLVEPLLTPDPSPWRGLSW